MKTIFLILAAALALVAGMGAVLADGPPLMALTGDSGKALPFIGLAGLLVNKTTLDSIFTGLKTIFNNTLKAMPGNWQATAMEVPSDSSEEDYAWLTRFPKFRRWVGDKHVKALEAGKYTKVNEDWETTISVRRNDIEDDRLGIYNTQAQLAADSAGELHDIIVDELKNGAFTNEGIDGQYFYDTDHVVAGASVSNKGTAALSAADFASASASYGAGRSAIMNYKDDEGMALRLMPNVLEVPPALEAVGRKLVEAGKLDDNSPNPYRGTATLIVNPALTSSTAWFLHVTNKAVKPFIVQVRKRPVFVSQTSMENDDVFNRGEFKFGAEARAAGVYGFWQLSYGSTGAG